jgi:hypothetical protein
LFLKSKNRKKIFLVSQRKKNNLGKERTSTAQTIFQPFHAVMWCSSGSGGGMPRSLKQ